MKQILRKNSPIHSYLGTDGTAFLEHSLRAFERILPHTEVCKWWEKPRRIKAQATWADNSRKSIRITISVGPQQGNQQRHLSSELKRRQIPKGIGKFSRTLDTREHKICQAIFKHLSKIIKENGALGNHLSLRSIRDDFDEQIIAQHLHDHHHLDLDVFEVLASLHMLAEQTYENKQLAFGCILDPKPQRTTGAQIFPQQILDRKRYRALSDGFRSAYHVANNGALLRFVDLEEFEKHTISQRHFYPQWAEALARASRKSRCGICLNRNGDILVFDEGSLRFTYRFGIWQYWNHNHIVDLLKNLIRVQRVPPTLVSKVASAVYRAALDSAFRRAGALFVILRLEKDLREIVPMGDAIKDQHRDKVDQAFDGALPSQSILSLPRTVLVELSSLDGAIVLNNRGKLLAYGAVLNPRKKGKRAATEGSRTKAAIGASKYGIAVKVSSDGDITVFHQGKEFLRI